MAKDELIVKSSNGKKWLITEKGEKELDWFIEWFKQGDTTSLGTGTSYSKSNVTSSDAGKYYVRVTNKLNGKDASTDSFKVTVTITSSEIGSANGGFDFK